MHNAIADAPYAKYADDMRARLYEMMGKFEDPYGTPAKWTLPGQKPDRYGAPRYLPRGKRLVCLHCRSRLENQLQSKLHLAYRRRQGTAAPSLRKVHARLR